MGSTCTICKQANKYNPIIEDYSKKQETNTKPQNEAVPPRINNLLSGDLPYLQLSNKTSSPLKGLSPYPDTMNMTFSDLEFTNYLNLQKLLLTKNTPNIKHINFNELSYEGQLGDNYERNGKGILKWPDGTTYIGEWANNKANGRGLIFFCNSDRFEGNFTENCYEGEGVYISNKGNKFEGLWSRNIPEGFGVETFSEGHKFEGFYTNGKKNGKGVLKLANGSYFSGEFKNNDIDGYGVLIWPIDKKMIYKGNWKNNKMNGIGHMIWFDCGKMYYGNYINNKKNGLGLFFWGLQKQWVGYWNDGMRDGPGILINKMSSKEIDKGIWDQGKRIHLDEIQEIQSGNSQEIYQEIEKFYENSMKELFEKNN